MKNQKTLIYIGLVILVVGTFVYLSPSNRRNDVQNANGSSRPALTGNVIDKAAPDFSLEDMSGNVVKLSDYKGKNVVLFFNEGEMCYPACWDQVRELGTDARFDTTDTVAFSIVVDSKEQWKRIQSQMPQFKKAKILFDLNRKVSSAYGVLSLPSSMHPGSFPGHTYFLIDKEGIIRFFLDDPNMAIRNDQLVAEINKLAQN